MLEQRNSHVQGNIGLTVAMIYFASKGCIISLPLNDIQDYDLVADFDNEGLKKVQVKTTRCKERGKYKVVLRSAKKGFEHNKSDYLFIVDGDGVRYLIPRNEVKASSGIVLGNNYTKYIV
jgi:hypothetical protein